jgi:dihydroflavonol-4-reductase
MRTLITGVTGLLGGNVARVMAEDGRSELRVLVRESSNQAALAGLEVERVFGDIRDQAAVARAVAGCERVVHCAASVSQWRPNREMMVEVNVTGTANVLEAARRAGVSRVVYVSTVDTLGLSSLEHPADETCEHASMAAFGNPYVDTKYAAEQRAKAIAAQGLDLVIVKPTYMIGAYDVKPTSGQMIVQVAKGRALAYPGGGNNFVDVLDVARGIILAMDQGRAGESYILANRDGNLTYREMFTRIARIVGAKPPRWLIPYPAALAGGLLFDLAGRLLRYEPDVNSVTARMGYAPHYFTPAKAIAELSLPQSPLEPAIARAYQWLKSQNMI